MKEALEGEAAGPVLGERLLERVEARVARLTHQLAGLELPTSDWLELLTLTAAGSAQAAEAAT